MGLRLIRELIFTLWNYFVGGILTAAHGGKRGPLHILPTCT
jgi:hypothetical protein